jgi:hypothetical protein
MTTTITESTTMEAKVPETRRRPKKKASGTKRRGPGSPKKVKASHKAASASKTPTPRKKAQSVRQNSKTQNVIDLLKAPGGATLNQLMKATGWQAHSVRGFLSGTVGKKMGLTVISIKTEAGERAYSIQA